jgi:hypothetical protein
VLPCLPRSIHPLSQNNVAAIAGLKDLDSGRLRLLLAAFHVLVLDAGQTLQTKGVQPNR